MNEWRGEAVRQKRKNGRTTAWMTTGGDERFRRDAVEGSQAWWTRVGECESKGEWRKGERENKGG